MNGHETGASKGPPRLPLRRGQCNAHFPEASTRHTSVWGSGSLSMTKPTLPHAHPEQGAPGTVGGAWKVTACPPLHTSYQLLQGVFTHLLVGI